MEWLASEWQKRGLELQPVATEPSASELDALQSGALLVPLVDSGLLRLTGSDRVDFLHGQISNEVRGLMPGRTNRSLLLNHRGHALAELRVLRYQEELRLVVDGDGLEVVEESLRRHIIFDQVELKRVEDTRVLTLQGPEAAELLGRALEVEAPAAGEFVSAELGGGLLTVVPARRSEPGGFDLLISHEVVDATVEALSAAGAVAGSRPALEVARVLAGIPATASEAGEGVLPQEAGLEPLVSYRKGCYLGQEIMARIEARGKLRRELAAVALDDLPQAGAQEIELEGRSVGKIGRIVRHPALGALALAVLRTDVALEAPLKVAGVPCRRLPLPVDVVPSKDPTPSAP